MPASGPPVGAVAPWGVAGDTVNLPPPNATSVAGPQLEVSPTASMSPFTFGFATCLSEAILVHVDGDQAGYHFTLRIQSGSVVVSDSHGPTYLG
jgi:hypothetical protein